MAAAPFLPGTASLVEEVDKKLLVVLRDGRKLIGILRSYDQFANLVLQDTIERIHVGNMYGDVDRGVFLVRGENVVLLGEIDPAREDLSLLNQVSFEEILQLQKDELEAREKQDRIRQRILLERGFSLDPTEQDFF